MAKRKKSGAAKGDKAATTNVATAVKDDAPLENISIPTTAAPMPRWHHAKTVAGRFGVGNETDLHFSFYLFPSSKGSTCLIEAVSFLPRR